LEDLFSKFATGKDFSDSDKETLYAYAKKINLSEYINIELLEVLLKNNSPYVCKDGDKYLFDADVIIENQKNSKTLLDQDYVDRLLQENSQL
jgi:hypothetical protein